MHIAYVTTYDPHDLHRFSGITAFMAQALERHGARLSYVGPLDEPWSLLFKVKQQAYRSLLRRDHHRDREPYLLRQYGRQVAARLQELRPDYVLSPSTIPIAQLDTDVPIAFWTDAVFDDMVGFYDEFTGLSRATLRNGHAMEHAALHRARLSVFSSEWAASGARRHYDAPADRLHVLPFGANLHAPPSPAEVERFIAARPTDTCRLLFAGVDWERKGGAHAVAVAQQLNDAGLPTELTVLGAAPAQPLPAFVNVLGFADKKTEAGRKTVRRAFAQAHFLILPTRADCTPLVFNEANAYGVPALTSDVGGIPTIIQSGHNGFTAPLDALQETLATAVRDCFSDDTAYRRLAISARETYEARLNWDVSAKRLLDLMAHNR